MLSMTWPFNKTVVVEKQQGVNWEEMLVKMNANVKTYGNQIGKLETIHKEHVVKQDKDLDKMKDHICKKIAEIKCPKGEEVDTLVKEKGEQNGQIGELDKKLTKYVAGIEKAASERDTLEKVKKAIWKKVGLVLTYVFLGTSALTAFITWLMGMWPK